ncbi:hypothetical protein GCM10023170_066850 [Phytohabitans houttuyneae]
MRHIAANSPRSARAGRGPELTLSGVPPSALLHVLDQLRAAEVGDRSVRRPKRSTTPLIEAEPTAVIGAELHYRTGIRTPQRNGHRPLTTTAGDLRLRIPRLRSGSFFHQPPGTAEQ